MISRSVLVIPYLTLSFENSVAILCIFLCSVSVFPFMLAKPDAKSVTLAGSCTAWSMVSSLMDRCPATRPLVMAMTPLIHFLARQDQESMFHEPSLSI